MSEDAVRAIRAGQAVILPADTVYGLVADGYREAPARALHRIKRRPESVPVALLAADLDVILDAIPELSGRAATLARRVLPGPYTLVLPNPAGRFPWLCGSNPGAIGIRVPELPAVSREILEQVSLVAATSANLHGHPDAARVEDLDPEVLAEVGAVVDGGPLPGTPSTVIDLTGDEPVVLRDGAVPAADALARLATA